VQLVLFCRLIPSTGQRVVTGLWEARSPEVQKAEGGEDLTPLVTWKMDGYGEDGLLHGHHETVGRISRHLAEMTLLYRGGKAQRENWRIPDELAPEGFDQAAFMMPQVQRSRGGTP